MNKRIGRVIREIREECGNSQADISERLNISRSAYARMECGETSSWVHYIDDICQIFEVRLIDSKGYYKSICVENLKNEIYDKAGFQKQ